jgi:pyochelin biosynthetic protein PchG
MAAKEGRLQVVVCGAVFGQVYLEAFRLNEYPMDLVGILAHGSSRAQACARHYGVPLFTSVEEIPAHVDAACVVVRSRILGGKGTDLAHALMRRGIHVIQEHPVHPDEMAESLRLARAQRVLYRLNSFYVNVGPVRRFIGAARELCRKQKPLFVDAVCGCQLSFSLLDIIGTSLVSLRPWEIKALPHQPSDAFVTIKAVIAGVQTTLRIQNQLDPADPDDFSYFMHQITFGSAQGRLTLVDTHGPVVWIPRPQFPREVRSQDAAPQFASHPSHTPRLTVIGSAQAPSFDEIFRNHWPAGVVRALLALRHAILNQEDPLQAGQHQLTICELWRDMLSKTGPPALVRGERWSALPAESLAAIDRAASEMEHMP